MRNLLVAVAVVLTVGCSAQTSDVVATGRNVASEQEDLDGVARKTCLPKEKEVSVFDCARADGQKAVVTSCLYRLARPVNGNEFGGYSIFNGKIVRKFGLELYQILYSPNGNYQKRIDTVGGIHANTRELIMNVVDTGANYICKVRTFNY